MQAVEFHTGVADPVTYTVRMLRKAYAQGTRVLVTAPAAELEHISRQLWVVYEHEFLAHVMADHCRPNQRARAPLWLAAQATAADDEPRVLINRGAAAPPDPARFERLIEVVSTQPEDAAAGRQRWRHYVAAGLQMQHFKAD